MIGLGLALSHSLSPQGAGDGFVGPLDGFTAGLAGMWSVSRRLLASHTGPLVRIRRSSDDAESDIGYDADGLVDIAAITAFVSGADWFFSKFYEQSGKERHLTASTAGQPQGGVDANGLVYAYAPGEGFSTTNMIFYGFSISATDTTHWTVFSSPGYAFTGVMLRSDVPSQRLGLNFGNEMAMDMQDSDIGTTADVTGSNTGLYSQICQFNSSGNRLNNGVSAATGSRVSSDINIIQFGIGSNRGGPTWVKNGRFYGGALWITDLGNTGADEVQLIGKNIFNTQ